MARLKVLIVHRYYWPDTPPCASIMRTIACHLAAEQHEVEVLSSKPSYRDMSRIDSCPKTEELDGVLVRRLKLPTELHNTCLRILNGLTLGLSILRLTFKQRYDVIIATSIPPILGGFFSALTARLTGSRFIYFCMDLHPEIARVSGDFSNQLLFRFLQRIDDWSCQQAKPILVHSRDMQNTLRHRTNSDKYDIQIINNFALPSDPVSSNAAQDLKIKQNKLTLIYAGNIGRFQGLEMMIDVMAQLKDREDIELIVMGNGVAKDRLRKRASSAQANVRFFDHQPIGVAKNAICEADIAIISLSNGVYQYAFPSKLMTYLEQGKPIIAIVEPSSQLACDMSTKGYGYSVPFSDMDGLASLIRDLADNDCWKPIMREAALRAFTEEFSAKFILNRWSLLFKK